MFRVVTISTTMSRDVVGLCILNVSASYRSDLSRCGQVCVEPASSYRLSHLQSLGLVAISHVRTWYVGVCLGLCSYY